MDLESKTLNELREMAKEKGIEKYSSMRKADLIKKLTPERQAKTEKREPTSEQRRDQNDRRQNYPYASYPFPQHE